MVKIETEFKTSHFTVYPYFLEHIIGIGEKWENSPAQTVAQLHAGINRHDEKGRSIPDTGIPPKIIFATATSAIPYAFVIKECWINAYPEEKPPAFLIIDVSKKRFGSQDVDQPPILSKKQQQIYDKKEVQKLRRHGKKLKAFVNTTVLDEFSSSGVTLRKAAELLKQAGFYNVNFIAAYWDQFGFPESEKPIRRHPDISLPFRPLLIQNTLWSKNLIQDLKQIGRLMAKEIITHDFKP